MLEAAFWGLVGASALVIGAEIAFAFELDRLVIGLIMAFGVGTLISSISFELVEASLDVADGWLVGLGLAVGALTFFLGDRAIGRLGGDGRKSLEGTDPPSDADETAGGARESGETGEGGEADQSAAGMGIALGSALDGVPESAALGISLAAGGGVSVPLLAAIWISNFPESLGSSVNMLRAGRTKGWVRKLWWSIAALSTVSAAIGYWVITVTESVTGAFVQSFAAGALLTMIADEMAPEAYGKSALLTGLSTTAGFALAVYLGTLE